MRLEQYRRLGEKGDCDDALNWNLKGYERWREVLKGYERWREFFTPLRRKHVFEIERSDYSRHHNDTRTMASPNVYYTNNDHDLEEQNQFDSLLGNTRQRRIGGSTPYRDDPVSFYHNNHNDRGRHVVAVPRLILTLSSLSLFTRYNLRMDLLSLLLFQHKNSKMLKIKRISLSSTDFIFRLFLVGETMANKNNNKMANTIIEMTLMMLRGAVALELPMMQEYG